MLPRRLDPRKPWITRQFLDFDPLQLEYDSNSLVDTPNVMNFTIYLFRQWRYKIYFSLFMHKNMFLTYENNMNLNDFLKVFCKNVEKSNFGDFTDIDFYDFDKSLTDLTMDLDRSFSFFVYHPYEKNLKHFMENMLVFREEIRLEAKKRKVSELSNKRIQFIFIHLGENEIKDLKNDKKLLEDFQDLMCCSLKERIVFVPTAQEAKDFDKNFISFFDFIVFMGKSNMDTAQYVFFPENFITRYSFAQEKIGFVYTARHRRLLFVAHPYKKVLTQEFLERQEKQKAEREEYKRYLEELEKQRLKIEDRKWIK